MPRESHWKQLEEIVGPDHLSFDTESLRARGWEGPLPAAIAFPASPAEVSEIMRLVRTERLRVAPAGHSTKHRMGGCPQQMDLLLSLHRLNRITDYQAADLTVSLEAGVTLQQLEGVLRAGGQRLPLGAHFGGEATVGGTLATNGSGPWRLAYGSARDVVLGVGFVTADGKRVKSGGKVVKNVAGYDMAKLLIGSFGTLGILTEVTFKVFPVPPASTTIVFGFTTAADAVRASHRILNSPFAPQAMDVLDRAAGALTPQAKLLATPFSLLVASAGPEAVVERVRRDLPLLVRGDRPESAASLAGAEESSLWEAVRELTPAMLQARPGTVVVKASVLLTQIEATIEKMGAAAEENGLALARLARAGSGIVYGYLYPKEQNSPSEDRFAKVVSLLIEETERRGGRAVVEWCPSGVKQRVSVWGSLQDDFSMMRRLKAELDPLGLLNPGRFYGGI